MKIWVDADACPVAVKELLYRAADRKKIKIIFVANKYMKLPRSLYTEIIVVSSGFDVADNEILKRMDENDLVVTSDIPLAYEVIEKNGFAVSPRGEVFSMENIKSKLNTRDFMETLRASGIETKGPAPFGNKEKHLFASALDKYFSGSL